MARVFKTGQCHLDLVAIGRHIARDNPTAALKLLDAIDDKLQFLADNPALGEARGDLERCLRSFSIKSYVIYFQPCPEGIDVLRILHGAQDANAVF